MTKPDKYEKLDIDKTVHYPIYLNYDSIKKPSKQNNISKNVNI